MAKEMDRYLARYHQALCEHQPKAASSYSLEELTNDVRLSMVDMHMQYLVFTMGVMPGYKDPANREAKEYWEKMIRRNCETLHYSGSLDALAKLAAALA